MKLEAIITLGNAAVRYPLLAMERSLRATGCQLPLLVIPYDDQKFDLPPNASWWEDSVIIEWLKQHGAHPMMRKYQSLLRKNYQYVDADVCFVRNPADVLAAHEGFVVACGHWHNPAETTTEASRRIFLQRSTCWQKSVFNAGQFACDRALYTASSLIQMAEQEDFAETCLHYRWHDQPGLNLLVHAADVPVRNLTLPPYDMQSTWAGDYLKAYRPYWENESRMPYLIHWAGGVLSRVRPINALFEQHLSPDELVAWTQQRKRASNAKRSWPARLKHGVLHVGKAIIYAWRNICTNS